MRLARLFSPKSIVVIGGGAWGQNVAEHNRKLGFQGDIWIVHPQGKAVGGEASFRTIAELPHAPDAAYVCVNRHASIEALRELKKIGCGGAVCLAAGFSEAAQEDESSASLQEALIEAAGDMPFLGPNCYGFINLCDNFALWPDQHGCNPREEGVAILAQSSNIAMNLTFIHNGLPISHMFAIGNQAQTSMAEVGLELLKDPRVKAIGLHIEGIKDLTAFEELAQRAYEAEKPIVVLKVGKSEVAQKATMSHTASLAGNHQAAEAFLKRCGFLSVKSLPEFVETLKLCATVKSLASTKISSISCSGGEASLMGDLALDTCLSFPALTQECKTELRAALSDLVALANPLDYNTYIWRNQEKLTQVFTAMGKADHAINLIILDYPRSDRCNDEDWCTVEKACIAAKLATGANFGIVATLPDNMPEERAEFLMANGIVPFAGLAEALSAVEKLALRSTPHSQPVCLAASPVNCKRYEEREAKEMLLAAGLPAPRSILAISEQDLLDAFAKLSAPLVLKGQGFAHKTENNAVVLNINSQEQLIAAARAMKAQGYLIEEMVQDIALELLVGVNFDPCFGAMLTLGAGGVYTEILKDTASLLLPADRDEIAACMKKLRIAPRLSGYRGQAALAQEQVLDIIMALQDFILSNKGKISEIEINPLVVGRDFAMIVDALIIGDLQ